jgi:hypothetical protein
MITQGRPDVKERSMTISAAAAPPAPHPITTADYQPGVCNIGPAEIARRRRSGHIGLIASVVLLAILVAIGAPPLFRLLLILPVAVSASGYLQAYLKFCAGFGAAGVYNFGEVGTTDKVVDAAAKRRDRTKSFQISGASFAIGLAVAVVAVLLPV